MQVAGGGIRGFRNVGRVGGTGGGSGARGRGGSCREDCCRTPAVHLFDVVFLLRLPGERLQPVQYPPPVPDLVPKLKLTGVKERVDPEAGVDPPVYPQKRTAPKKIVFGNRQSVCMMNRVTGTQFGSFLTHFPISRRRIRENAKTGDGGELSPGFKNDLVPVKISGCGKV